MGMRVCPRCGSEDVEIKPTVVQAAFGLSPSYKCNKCGFEGDFFSEVEDDA